MQKPKALLIPAALFLLLALVQHASAANWVEVAENNSGWVWYVDRDSVQADHYNNCATVWEKSVYIDDSYTMTMCTYDFSDRTYRDIVVYEYDADGRITDSDDNPGGWDYIIPDSIAESIYTTVRGWLGW